MEKKKGLSLVSLIVLIIDIIYYSFFTILWGGKIPGLLALFKSLDAPPPALTKIMLFLGPAFLIVIIFILIAKERLDNKLKTLIVNAIAFFLLYVISGIYNVAVFLPIFRQAGL